VFGQQAGPAPRHFNLHVVHRKVTSVTRPRGVHELEPLRVPVIDAHVRAVPRVPLVPALGPERRVGRAAIVRPLEQHCAHGVSVHMVLEAHRGHVVTKVAVHAELDSWAVGTAGLGEDIVGSVVGVAGTSRARRCSSGFSKKRARGPAIEVGLEGRGVRCGAEPATVALVMH